MSLTTPRYALPYPETTDADNVPADMHALALAVSNAMQGYSQGTLASRPAFGVTGREYRATDTGFTYMDIGTAWVIKSRPIADGAAVLAYNAAWPASPIDGQETDRYSDAAKQAIWRFRYDNAQAAGEKWVLVGGGKYVAGQIDTSVAATSRATPIGTMIGLGTSFVCGVAGIYEVDYSWWGYGATTGHRAFGKLFPDVGASRAGNAYTHTDDPTWYGFDDAGSGLQQMIANAHLHTFVAGTTYQVYVGSPNSNPVHYNCEIRVRPVRVT